MKEPVVIVANGSFPVHPLPLSFIDYAGTLICTDGAAKNVVSHGKHPDIIIGDMDSVQDDIPENIKIVEDMDQYSNDLDKAIKFCISSGIGTVTIVGATELRDDHHFANILLLQHYHALINCTIVSDRYTILVSQGEHTYLSFAGQTISIFSPFSTPISTTDLKFNLKGDILDSPSRGVSNESLGNKFSVRSEEPVILMLSHDLIS